MKKAYETLEEVLTECKRSKKPITVVYRTHTGMSSDPRQNLIVEKFNETTEFLQLAHYKNEKKDVTIYTKKNEIVRIMIEE